MSLTLLLAVHWCSLMVSSADNGDIAVCERYNPAETTNLMSLTPSGYNTFCPNFVLQLKVLTVE